MPPNPPGLPQNDDRVSLRCRSLEIIEETILIDLGLKSEQAHPPQNVVGTSAGFV
jgi:hypothetical protein